MIYLFIEQISIKLLYIATLIIESLFRNRDIPVPPALKQKIHFQVRSGCHFPSIRRREKSVIQDEQIQLEVMKCGHTKLEVLQNLWVSSPSAIQFISRVINICYQRHFYSPFPPTLPVFWLFSNSFEINHAAGNMRVISCYRHCQIIA